MAWYCPHHWLHVASTQLIAGLGGTGVGSASPIKVAKLSTSMKSRARHAINIARHMHAMVVLGYTQWEQQLDLINLEDTCITSDSSRLNPVAEPFAPTMINGEKPTQQTLGRSPSSFTSTKFWEWCQQQHTCTSCTRYSNNMSDSTDLKSDLHRHIRPQRNITLALPILDNARAAGGQQLKLSMVLDVIKQYQRIPIHKIHVRSILEAKICGRMETVGNDIHEQVFLRLTQKGMDQSRQVLHLGNWVTLARTSLAQGIRLAPRAMPGWPMQR